MEKRNPRQNCKVLVKLPLKLISLKKKPQRQQKIDVTTHTLTRCCDDHRHRNFLEDGTWRKLWTSSAKGQKT